jgi:hypothetical protein
MTIMERREAYLTKHEAPSTGDDPEFEVPPRSTEQREFQVDESA